MTLLKDFKQASMDGKIESAMIFCAKEKDFRGV